MCFCSDGEKGPTTPSKKKKMEVMANMGGKSCWQGKGTENSSGTRKGGEKLAILGRVTLALSGREDNRKENQSHD